MSITKASLIDLNGQELILDADADTSITADTDDQIDIKIAGSDVITLTNSAINIGSATLNNNAILKLQTEGSDVANLQSAVQFRSHNDDFGITMQLESEASSNDILNVKYHNNSSGGVSVLQVDATNGNVVFNESGNDQDFRVESDSKTHALFVQGSDGFVGINATPTHPLEVAINSSGQQDLLLLSNDNTATSNTAGILFAPSNGITGARIECVAMEDFLLAQTVLQIWRFMYAKMERSVKGCVLIVMAH